MHSTHGGWKVALCLLCACGSRSGLGLGHDGAAPAIADSSIADRAPDASSVLLDGSPVLPDALVVRDVSSAFPDVSSDASPTPPDAPMFLDVSPALPDAPRDVSSAVPDASRDVSPALPDGSRDASPALPDASHDTPPSVPDGSRDVAPALPDASNEVQSSSPDGSLSAFCSGPTSHMVVNGIESYPVVNGGVIGYSCCAGGEIQAITETFPWSITVRWRNTDFVLPAALDLANLPKTWSVEVLVGCPPLPALCASPPDSYFSGLTGTLQVSGKIVRYDMSLCLSLAESPSSPHPLVHTLQLYAPQVHAGN